MSYVIFQHHANHTHTWYFTDGKYKSKWTSNIQNAKIFKLFETAAATAKPFTYAEILEVEIASPEEKKKIIGYHI